MGDYLQNVYFSKIIHENLHTGLSNQILSLACSIVVALLNKKTAVAIDNFLVDFSLDVTVNISDVINMKKTNEYLKSKYNIVLLDKNKMKFKLHKAYYGGVHNFLDVTKEISSYVSNEKNSLFISKNLNLNSLKEDPCPNIIKHFCLYYSLDEYNFIDNFSGILVNDIMSHPPTSLCIFDFGGSLFFQKFMPDIFNDILKNIKFIDALMPKYILNNNVFDNYEKINVVHLRLEDDALVHWGKQNNMGVEHFKTVLGNKCIGLIEKYIKKDELTVILSYSYENNVFNFLKNNNYHFLHVKKNIENKQREIYAIHDLLLSTKCNNVFIGNFCMKMLAGSSFSYYILQKLEAQNVKKVLINLDSIEDPEDVL